MPVGEKHNLAHRDRIGASAEDRKNAVPVNEQATKLHGHSDPTIGRWHLLRSCVCEFIGTFFLCMAVGVNSLAGDLNALMIGLMLAVYVVVVFSPFFPILYFTSDISPPIILTVLGTYTLLVVSQAQILTLQYLWVSTSEEN